MCNVCIVQVNNKLKLLGCIVDHAVILICLASYQDTYEPQTHTTGNVLLGKTGDGRPGSTPYIK